MFSRSVTRRASRSWRKSPTAASLARSGARARSSSSPIRFADEPQQRARRLARHAAGSAAARPRPRPPAASTRLGPGLAGHHRALVLRRRARHREHAAPPRRARSRSRRAPGRRRAPPSGSPAPDSTASETSSRASRKERVWLRASACVGVVGPDDREADRGTDAEQRGEHVERQRRRQPASPRRGRSSAPPAPL